MQEIKFNHNYKKLHNQTSAGLVYVGILIRKLNKENIEKYVGREGKIFKIVVEEQK